LLAVLESKESPKGFSCSFFFHAVKQFTQTRTLPRNHSWQSKKPAKLLPSLLTLAFQTLPLFSFTFSTTFYNMHVSSRTKLQTPLENPELEHCNKSETIVP